MALRSKQQLACKILLLLNANPQFTELLNGVKRYHSGHMGKHFKNSSNKHKYNRPGQLRHIMVKYKTRKLTKGLLKESFFLFNPIDMDHQICFFLSLLF